MKDTFLRIAILAVCTVVLGLTGINYYGSWADRHIEPAKLKRAIILEPFNAEHRLILGRYLLIDQRNSDSGIIQLEAASSLNPGDSRVWLELANADIVSGRLQSATSAVEKAVEDSPSKPTVLLEAANLFTVLGESERAFPLYRSVLLGRTVDPQPVILAAWRTSGDLQTMLDEVLPLRPDVYFAFQGILLEEHRAADADLIWQRTKQLHTGFDPQLAFSYIDSLLNASRVEDAQKVWSDLQAFSPDLNGYQVAGNAVENPRFESPILGGGFDWRIDQHPTIEVRQLADGLQINYSDSSEPNAGVSQWEVLQPASSYRLYARYKSDVAPSIPFLKVFNPYSGREMAKLQLPNSSALYQPFTVFSTEPNQQAAVIAVGNDAGVKVNGTLQFAEIGIEKVE